MTNKEPLDCFFPFSKTLVDCENNNALPTIIASHLDSAFEVAKTFAYGRTNLRHPQGDQGSLKDLVSRMVIDGLPRHFQNEQSWQTLTVADADFRFGFVDVALNGCELDAAPYTRLRLNKPVMENLRFIPFAASSPSEYEGTFFFKNLDEARARESIASIIQERIIYAGCLQRNLNHPTFFCCTQTTRPSTPKEQRKQEEVAIQQGIVCKKNKAIHTMVGNHDLFATPEDNIPYISVYAFRPLSFEHGGTIANNLRQGGVNVSWQEQSKFMISSIEIGVLQPDSALDISMDIQKREHLHAVSHPFHASSTHFWRENERCLGLGKGPNYHNPSQLFAMGAWHISQVQRGVWQNHQTLEARSVEDPGTA